MPPTLSKNEVDALMTALNDGEIEAGQETEAGLDGQGSQVEAYDLTSRDRIVRGRMPTLDAIHSKMLKRYGRSLSGLLCAEMELLGEQTRPMKLGEFLSYQNTPSCINLLNFQPLLGTGLLCIETGLFFQLLNIVLGGGEDDNSNFDKNAERDFTPVEVAFAQKLTQLLCTEAAAAWKDIYPLNPSYLGTEMSPQHLTIGGSSDILMVSRITLQLAGREGHMDLAIPYATLEPIKHKLVEHLTEESSEDRDAWVDLLQKALKTVPLELQVELGRSPIKLKQLLSLEVGDVVRLDKHPASDLQLHLAGIPMASVRPMENNGNIAFEFSRWRNHERND